MFNFEHPLKMLKHQTLKEVALLAKEDKLNQSEIQRLPYKIIPGPKANYRCCVYHERAIIKERAKLASGYVPSGDECETLEELKSDQMIYVIPSACDRCPIDRYRVTDVCRGCIKHKCMEVCPVNAITRVNGQAHIDQDLCKECGMCSKACPYNAISEVMRPCKKACPTGALDVADDRRAMIKEEKCINCGACMDICPFGAISDRSYITNVVRALEDNKEVFAVVAPAITGQFGPKVTVGQIKSAFLQLGFKGMVEAACGADAVTVHEANEFVERMEEGQTYMTNSCCPGFVNFIEKMFPDQKDKISSTVSPMVATGRLIKKLIPDAVVVFVGPCTAKKNEITRPSIKDAIDYVMTFEEMTALFDAYGIDPEKCEESEANDASLYGRGFAQSGGLTAAVENYIHDKNINIEFKPIKVSGGAELKKTMTLAKTGKLGCNFIEGMMCTGGCIGGPATMVSMLKSKPQLVKFSNSSESKSVLSNEKLQEFEGVNLER
ncbi:MAG: 4Fe-4S binding protein [Clostridiales bacterium]|uniref:4Fe-4S dicluster domain-containing protein n=1 Tax=Clostridium sp. N3C TaxID=1776758 RepID=UPI00092DF456|nr:4Fe-4S dicluster domain-containing protein [Clostridium sp. N3C]NLZ47990.1 4Fe-4S binding protein [Clostridiales bacterium]SCN24420.1 Iron hydrogenase 1 [Clostridium sp. N3C]